MMGGRRCGKTSALSSLFYQMIHGETNKFLTVSDITPFTTKGTPGTPDYEEIDSLNEKRLELTNLIETQDNNEFLSDANPTNHFWDYHLRLQLPGTNKYMTMTFRDANGEFFEAGGRYHNETMEFVEECDVFVIIVDCTYLMEGTNVQNEAANRPDDIHTFITGITGNEKKQVIFVPIKCEKWVREGRVEEVCQKLVKTYHVTIDHLMASPNVEVSIIPIQTAGDIQFSELRKPYIVYNSVTQTIRKCSKVTDRLVILSDGTNYKLRDTDTLEEDPEGIFAGLKITRPVAWYHLAENATYSPYNCEQLPLHIIRFMMNKANEERFLPNWLLRIFGSITGTDLQNVIQHLSANNLIKENVDGIKILKKCFP